MREIITTAPEIFIDNQKKNRSGHMGHALVEAAPGEILDFYSNCSYDRVDGHSGYGWMEYKRSLDGGESWDEGTVLLYSMRIYEQGVHTALCEKAVKAPNGDLVLFFQITDASEEIACEPWSEPTLITSSDKGYTWSEGRTFGADKGRIYDAVVHDGSIYVLMESNEHFLGSKPEHCYKVYKSDDNAQTFREIVLPIDAYRKGYGVLQFSGDTLYAYAYDEADEEHMTYTVSEDFGETWSEPAKSYVAKKIRNPQIGILDGLWILHGRNGGAGDGLVLYTSEDGVHWDEGRMIAVRPVFGCAYYSNNIVITAEHPEEKNRMLVQFSHVYDKNRVNIMHFWLTVKE